MNNRVDSAVEGSGPLLPELFSAKGEAMSLGDYGVIFDLDGVIVSTDECHYRAWKMLADEEGISFDRETNHRLRGVSRMESLEILLGEWSWRYSDEEKALLAEKKNRYYRDMLQVLTQSDVLPGVHGLIDSLREHGIRIAIGSSSRNCPLILDKIGLAAGFDAIVDGNCISRSKPDPEVFLNAADQLGLDPAKCLVIEDAEAGLRAGLAAGMPVISIGAATLSPLATLKAKDLTCVSADMILDVLGYVVKQEPVI